MISRNLRYGFHLEPSRPRDRKLTELSSFERRLLEKLSGSYTVFLDARGREWTSEEFAAWLGQRGITQANLASVLEQLRVDNLILSPLFIKAVSRHGNGASAPKGMASPGAKIDLALPLPSVVQTFTTVSPFGGV